MSLGGGADYKTNPIADLANKLTAYGMAVVAAAGNDGNYGIGMVNNAVFWQGTPLPSICQLKKAINLPSSATVFPLLQQDGSLQDGCDAASCLAAVKGKGVLVSGDFNRCSSNTCGGMARLLEPLACLSSPFIMVSQVSLALLASPWRDRTSVAKKGAGVVNVENAIEVKTVISLEHIQLLGTVHFAGNIAEVSYDAANTRPLPMPLWGFDFAKAGLSAKVKVQFTQSSSGKAEHLPLYSGYIIATPSDIATVPIVNSDLGFPVIQINDEQQPLAKDQKIAFSKDEVYLVIRLGSHTPDLRVILTESVSGKFVGYLNTAFRPSWGPFGRIGQQRQWRQF
ncbi:hypothetical protein BGZ82_011075 [Podila clonocystis]|nr:hypothetical protein BGZ82_011075 [Podila clonocystis]